MNSNHNVMSNGLISVVSKSAAAFVLSKLLVSSYRRLKSVYFSWLFKDWKHLWKRKDVSWLYFLSTIKLNKLIGK